MVRYLFLLCFCTTLYAGIFGTSKHPKSKLPELPGSMVMKPGDFTEVKIDGKMDVDLHDGYKEAKIIIHGHPQDLAHIKKSVQNSAVRLKLSKNFPRFGPIHVEIRTKSLEAFEYHGEGRINGPNLNSRLMSLIIENNGSTTLGKYLPLYHLELSGDGNINLKGVQSKYLDMELKNGARVHMSGMVNLGYLEMTDDSWLNMYWVNAKKLHIMGRGNAYIQLAGIAEHLYLSLCQQAHFEGKHLRALSSFVKTHDTAIAEISSVNKQHSLSTDNSDIYYYELPDMMANFMIFNGSTLDLRDINDPLFEEPTRYNKPPYD